MYAIIKLENQRHSTYILMNTLGMSQVQNTSFLRERAFYESISTTTPFRPKVTRNFSILPNFSKFFKKYKIYVPLKTNVQSVDKL